MITLFWFWDSDDAGFYFTAKGSDNVMPRRKQVYDGALPSGNSVALMNLLRLSLLTGEAKYRDFASQIIRVFSEEVKRAPTAHTFMLLGVDFALGPSYNVIIVGAPQEPSMRKMLGALKVGYLQNLAVSLRLPERAGVGYERIDGLATAYVCRGETCMPPTNNPEKMLKLLGLA